MTLAPEGHMRLFLLIGGVLTLCVSDDGITKATRAMGAADPVNKSFSERMNLFKKVEAVDHDGGEEEEAAEY